MVQLTHLSDEKFATREANTLRARGKRMLELATRASCEQHYDFARLLTQLATEVFAHARDVEHAGVACAARPVSKLPAARRR